MRFGGCSREPEVLAAVRSGVWPAAVDPALHEHVAHCGDCSEVALVSQTMAATRAEAVATAPLASPGVIWWRAQLRRRREAIERVERPILWAEVGGLIGVVAMVVFVAWQWIGSAAASVAPKTQVAAAGFSLSSGWALATVGIAAVVLAGAMMVYLAIDRE